MILVGIALVGAVAAFINSLFVENSMQRFMQGYLVAFAFVLSISLGSLFFVLVQHLMRAGWSVVVRRFSEVLCLNILVTGLLFLPVAWSVWNGDGLIYSWSQSTTTTSASHANLESAVPQNHTVSLVSESANKKTNGSDQTHGEREHSVSKPFLNRSRFLITWGVLFAIWIGLGVFYYRCSVMQDRSGDVNLTRKMEWWSGIATILFGFSLTLGAFDLLMSLDPAWYSTIFGVYYFSGCAVAGLASLLLIVLLLKRFQIVPSVFSDEVQRDLGRLLFAFVFFWAYIGFSQYMLLWYANMPETTGWLVNRGMSTATGYTNSWGWLAIFLLVAHFFIPFSGFMSRHVKSNSKIMIFWVVWLLVIHYFDLYWIVIPQSNPNLTISFVEIGTAVFVISIYCLAAWWIATRANLFAVGDPRINESLSRQAMY